MIMKTILLFLLALCPLVSNSQVNKISFVITGGIDDKNLKKTIESNTSELLMRLNEAYPTDKGMPKLDPKKFSQSGLEAVNDLWNREHIFCNINKISENVLTKPVSTSASKDISYQVRNIPIIFGKSDSLSRSIVLEYLPDGRINDFYIGMSNHMYKGVMDVNGVVEQTRRQIILNFIENLRTYYLKKDIDNIRKLYSDKALIIVGKVLETVTPVDHPNFIPNQSKYIVLKKDEYIDRLQKVFNNTKYLYLDFDSIEVIKHGKHENFYGVLLLQTWNASNYNDKGWLFLLVQFKENEEPLIWVRTWQDYINTPPDSVFGLHIIKIPDGGIVNN
jgi:hypothetical protein